MNRSVWSRAGIGAAVSLLMALGSASAHAEGDEDSLSLKIASALRGDRLFMRAGVIGVRTKTKSSDTYDVTGPVMTRRELSRMAQSGGPFEADEGPIAGAGTAIRDYLISKGVSSADAISMANAIKSGNGLNLLVGQLRKDGITGLGTPAGIKGKASEEMGTAGFSLGYYLDDDHKWVVETYVLAAPLSTSVSATGRSTVRASTDTGEEYWRPFGLEGQKILSSKVLPPLVILGRYWGDKGAKFQPYTGVVGMYAIFFDSKATDALNNYVGGSNPGDTTVSLKNAFGMGPMLGFKYSFGDDWHVSLNVGSVKLKTQGTLTTRNTLITDSTGAIQDYGRSSLSTGVDENGDPVLGGSVSDTIYTGQVAYGPSGAGFPAGDTGVRYRSILAANGGLVGVVSGAVGYLRSGGTSANLGTYVRKADTTLTSTMFMLSVGRSF